MGSRHARVSFRDNDKVELIRPGSFKLAQEHANGDAGASIGVSMRDMGRDEYTNCGIHRGGRWLLDHNTKSPSIDFVSCLLACVPG